MNRVDRILYTIIFVTIPFIIWAKLQILPTFDDWNSITADYHNWTVELFYRHDSFWRPFDEILKYIYSQNYQLFPVLSHVIILIGHLINTYLIYLISDALGFNRLAKSMATTFFYLSPCMLATLWACDSTNQTLSKLWGLLALFCYLQYKGTKKYLLWAIIVFLATLTKENGLTWAFIPPIIAFGFSKISIDILKKEFVFAGAIVAFYLLIRFAIPMIGEYDPEYTTISIAKYIKQLGILIGFTWIAVDYVYLLHEPSRNLLIALITFLLSFPFIVFVFKNISWKNKTFLSLAGSAIMAVLPNLLTNLSVMNTYTSLGICALLVGYCVNLIKKTIYIKYAFAGYVISALFIDSHLWYTSWQTSLVGKEMAQQAIEKTGKPVQSVYTITVEDNIRKLSSFCVIPCEAFGWGISVKYATGMQWPKKLYNYTVAYDTNQNTIKTIAQKALNKGYDCVWVVNKNNIEVIKR